jgi:MFS family permease
MLAIYAVVFLDSLAISIVQLLQPYYALKLGVGPDLLTMVVAAFTAAQLTGLALWGRLSDRFGRRPALLATLGGGAAASLLLLLADTLPALAAVRALAGFMSATALVATAAIADVTATQHRARGIAHIGVAGGLGFIVGPVIGGHLAGTTGAEADFDAAFAPAAAASGIGLVLALFAIRETAPGDASPPAARAGSRLAALRRLLARPQFGLVLAVVFLPPLAGALIEPVLALWTEAAFQWGPEKLGYAYSLMGVATVITQGVLVAPAIARLGIAGATTLGAAALAAAPLWLVVAKSDVEVMAAISMLIFGMATSATALTTFITRMAGPGERGTLLGVSSLSSSSGRIVGPMAAGPLYAHAGMTAPFFAALAAGAVMAVLSLCLKPPREAAGPAPARLTEA